MNVILNHYIGHELHIDVITSTNKPLEPMLQGGGHNRSLAILCDLPVGCIVYIERSLFWSFHVILWIT